MQYTKDALLQDSLGAEAILLLLDVPRLDRGIHLNESLDPAVNPRGVKDAAIPTTVVNVYDSF